MALCIYLIFMFFDIKFFFIGIDIRNCLYSHLKCSTISVMHNFISFHFCLIDHFSERPTVVLDQPKLAVIPGETGFVICNATGHPAPTIQWVRKTTKEKMVRNI